MTNAGVTGKHEYVDLLFLSTPATEVPLTGCTVFDVGLTKDQVTASLGTLIRAVHMGNLAHRLRKVAPERLTKRYLKGQLVYEVHFNSGTCGTTETRTYAKTCESVQVHTSQLIAVHSIQQRVPNHAFTSANDIDEIQYVRQLVVQLTPNATIILETIKSSSPRPPYFRLSLRAHGPMTADVSLLAKNLIQCSSGTIPQDAGAATMMGSHLANLSQ